MQRLTKSVIYFSIFIIWITTSTAAEVLNNHFSISLTEKDRVLGTLEGNFLVYGRPYIAMYDDNGRKLWSRKLKNNVKPYLSDNGQFLALSTYADRSPTDLRTMKLEFFKFDGSLLWKINKPAATQFHIANNGNIIGIEGVPGIPPTRLHLYNASGNRITAINFDDYHGLRFSPGGERFVVDRGRNGLEVYDSKGEALAKLPPAKYFAFDGNSKHIGLFSDGVFRLFNNSEEINRIGFAEPDIKDLALNMNAGLLILMAEKRLEIYEPKSGKLAREFRLNENEKSFTSLDLSGDGSRFVCGVDINSGPDVPKDDRHSEGYLYIFTDGGTNLLQHAESYKSWRVGLPRAVIVHRDNAIMLQSAEAIKKLVLP